MIPDPITSRAEAQSLGHSQFYTGKPCKYGHVCRRNTASGVCQMCAVIKVREWRKKNPQRKKDWSRLEYEKKKDEFKKKARDWYRENTAQARDANRKWRKENPELFREYIKINAQKRRAQKLKANFTVTIYEIRDLIKSQKELYVYCKEKTNLTIDHIFPLSRGGIHHISNIQMLCGICNSSKGAKTHEEFVKFCEERA